VAAALVFRGRPVLSAIYQPVPELFFAARLGDGAKLNGRTIAVEDGASLNGAKVIGNRKSIAPLLAAGVAADQSGDLPLLLRLAHVASGQVAAAVSVGPKNDWDLAAGDLLVHEAGGLVTDLDGAQFKFNRQQPWQNGMVAGGKFRHGLTLERLRDT
jgi:myo-inositol-1(or 4)-monophosphatase